MMITDEQIARLKEHGIQLMRPDVRLDYNPFVKLPFEDVHSYLADPAAYQARRYGVDRDTFVRWKEALTGSWDDRCHGTTRTGERCNNRDLRTNYYTIRDGGPEGAWRDPFYCHQHEDQREEPNG
ncbi:MAG: hypothetical protein R6U63_13810 [Longimicrobiales bacterium]